MILDRSFPHIARLEPTQGDPAPEESTPWGPSSPKPPGAPEAKPREPIFRIPPATGWLIAINVAVFVAFMLLPDDRQDDIAYFFGFEPQRLFFRTDWLALVSLISFQFLHGSWGHLGINMITLLAFGPAIEGPLGRGRFVGLYLVCGVAGALVEAALSAQSDEPLVGASAGISGLFGAFLILWGVGGKARSVMSLVRLAGLWIVLMAVTGIVGIGAQGAQVAWIAHIGGFVAGMALVRPFARVGR